MNEVLSLKQTDNEILVKMKETIIGTPTDYHYSLLEEAGYTQTYVEGIEVCDEDSFEEYLNEHREEYFQYLLKNYFEHDQN